MGSGRRLTFDDAESALSEWMAENAFVVWHPCERPWELEEQLISEVRLPLNLDQNSGHEFHGVRTQLRRNARARARGVL